MSPRWPVALTALSALLLAPSAHAAPLSSVPVAWMPGFPLTVAGIFAGGVLLAVMVALLIRIFDLDGSAPQRSNQIKNTRE